MKIPPCLQYNIGPAKSGGVTELQLVLESYSNRLLLLLFSKLLLLTVASLLFSSSCKEQQLRGAKSVTTQAISSSRDGLSI